MVHNSHPKLNGVWGTYAPFHPTQTTQPPCNPTSLPRVHPLLPIVRVTRSIITHKLLAIVLLFLDTFYRWRGMNELSEAASAKRWTPKHHYKTAQTKADKSPTSLSGGWG